MIALLWALLWLVLLLLLIILVVISFPVRLDARFDTQQKPPLEMNFSVLGGVLPIPIKTGVSQKKQKKKKTKMRGTRKLFRIKPIFDAVPQLLSSLIKTIKIETLSANLGYGFPDPADTGRLFGLLKPIEYWIAQHEYARLTIQADFDHARLEGQGQITARMTPITLLPPALRFGWKAFLLPRLKR